MMHKSPPVHDASITSEASLSLTKTSRSTTAESAARIAGTAARAAKAANPDCVQIVVLRLLIGGQDRIESSFGRRLSHYLLRSERADLCSLRVDGSETVGLDSGLKRGLRG